MINWGEPIFDFLLAKTALTVINASSQFDEPDDYISFYALNNDTQTMSSGSQVYNAIDDKLDVTYAPISMVTLQIDVRGKSSRAKVNDLHARLQTRGYIEDLKTLGIYYMGVGSLTPIPNIQNGYVKEGYQFNLSFSYDSSITDQIDYATGVLLNGI